MRDNFHLILLPRKNAGAPPEGVAPRPAAETDRRDVKEKCTLKPVDVNPAPRDFKVLRNDVIELDNPGTRFVEHHSS